MTDADDLARLLEHAHAYLDEQPDRYPPRRARTTSTTYPYLTQASRDEAVTRKQAGETYSAIARHLGVSHSTIRRAVLGITQARPP